MVTVFVHGGVSGLEQAAPSLSYAIDAAGPAQRAMDAVERAVVALEDDPKLNAGFGAVLSAAGTLELDAGIVDGTSGRCGAVAGVNVRNPILLARRVLEQTPHVLMAGAGAMALSEGLELLADTTADQRARWQKARAEGSLTSANFGTAAHVDTVGAVALDDDGNLAAGSSTGGVFGKLPGRVGDACLFGAGVYASQAAAAVGTGVGELFIETLASYQAGRLIEDGAHPQEACEQVIERLGRTRRTSAGLLALDVNGRAGAAYRGGSWSVFGPDGRLEGTRLT